MGVLERLWLLSKQISCLQSLYVLRCHFKFIRNELPLHKVERAVLVAYIGTELYIDLPGSKSLTDKPFF